jgi:hypothetical protein
MRDKRLVCSAILLWLVLGLVLGLDYKSYGIVSGTQVLYYGVNLLTLQNPIFMHQMSSFLISLTLIGLACASVGTRPRLYICLESSFWVLKLFVLKDGYVTGFGGSSDEEIVFYDFIGVLLRTVLLGAFFLDGLDRKVPLLALPIAFLVIYLKMTYLAIPLYYLPIP